MRIWQREWSPQSGWSNGDAGAGLDPHLLFLFSSRELLESTQLPRAIRDEFPSGIVAGCSTAGEIAGNRVFDESAVVTAVHLEKSRARAEVMDLKSPEESESVGRALSQALLEDDLRHVIVLSEGLNVNGSALVRGVRQVLPAGVNASGGLSADGDRFGTTCVLYDGRTLHNAVIAIGLYGQSLEVGCASLGGWDPFGPERIITRSRGNVLYEMDGKPALDIYKSYLGTFASDLPASALRFPLAVRAPGEMGCLVRTVLQVDEAERSMIFAGDLPQGSIARLMKGNHDRLIEGAAQAARRARGSGDAELALLFSCVGRRLLLHERVCEEVESVQGVLGSGTVLAGFYSYGEIAPAGEDGLSELHNQSMTITTLREG